jgi:hypothetical protein
MASIQPSIPIVPTQPILYRDFRSAGQVDEARNHLLRTLKAAVQAINAEIFRLETTGTLVDTGIEKSYEALGWAVDSFREEQELAALEAVSL